MRTRRACKLLATIALVFAACTATSGEPGPAAPPREGGAPPPEGEPRPAPAPAPLPQAGGPGIGEVCGSGGVCAAGLSCVEYYGIAGPRGPKFTSCEIRCDGGAACPSGLSCTTVADGPGAVCRAVSQAKQTPPAPQASPSPQTPAPTPPPAQTAPAAPTPGLGASCGDAGACAAGLECIEYYGIAGPRGPKFASCEIRCARSKGKLGTGCPKGTVCTTISDGPGSVCRPAGKTQLPPPGPSGEVQ